MTDDQNEWAKPEDPQAQQQIDDFKDAQQAQKLRTDITAYARTAVKFGGVDRDWVNSALNRLGAELVTGDAEYKINVPIDGSYGTTITASSRAEALEKFAQITANIAESGEIRGRHCGEGVYGVTLTGGGPVFFSGPEDIEPDNKTPGLESLKAGIRNMLKEGVGTRGWGHMYAQQALEGMELPLLPRLVTKTVSVPVQGVALFAVNAFDGDDDEVAQKTAETMAVRTGYASVKIDEIGSAFVARPDSMDMQLVDDDED